jgi:hypothetical protein
MKELQSIADESNRKIPEALSVGMGLLAVCLDPNNRPTDSWRWLQDSFALDGEQVSEIVTGPRIDWFALKMREYYGGNDSVRFQDKCIKKYKKLLRLTDDQI